MDAYLGNLAGTGLVVMESLWQATTLGSVEKCSDSHSGRPNRLEAPFFRSGDARASAATVWPRGGRVASFSRSAKLRKLSSVLGVTASHQTTLATADSLVLEQPIAPLGQEGDEILAAQVEALWSAAFLVEGKEACASISSAPDLG